MTAFAYASYVADDAKTAAATLAQIGLPEVWRGRHDALGCDAILCATQAGGLLVCQKSDEIHPAAAARGETRERLFHVAISDTAELDLDRAPSSDRYDGPFGKARLLEIFAGDRSLWVEAYDEPVTVAAPDSPYARVESTPTTTASLQATRTSYEKIGIEFTDLGEVIFPTLNARSEIAILDGRHFVELNEPEANGYMQTLHDGGGGSGVFGITVEPIDFDAHVEKLMGMGLALLTPEPVILPVIVDGEEMDADRILTIHPKATGGARIFVVEPIEYPWNYLSSRTGSTT